MASESIRVMHDRRIPRSKANIDHIVVTPGGVWVINTRRYVGKAPEKRVVGRIIRPRVELLIYRDNEGTKLEGLPLGFGFTASPMICRFRSTASSAMSARFLS